MNVTHSLITDTSFSSDWKTMIYDDEYHQPNT